MIFATDIEPRSRVMIDGDPSLVGVVTSFEFRLTSDGGVNQHVEVSYVHNGVPQVAWVEPWRLTTS